MYIIYLPYKFTILVGKSVYIGYTIHTECHGSHVTPENFQVPFASLASELATVMDRAVGRFLKATWKFWRIFGDGKLGPGETNTSINQLRYGWGI